MHVACMPHWRAGPPLQVARYVGPKMEAAGVVLADPRPVYTSGSPTPPPPPASPSGTPELELTCAGQARLRRRSGHLANACCNALMLVHLVQRPFGNRRPSTQSEAAAAAAAALGPCTGCHPCLPAAELSKRTAGGAVGAVAGGGAPLHLAPRRRRRHRVSCAGCRSASAAAHNRASRMTLLGAYWANRNAPSVAPSACGEDKSCGICRASSLLRKCRCSSAVAGRRSRSSSTAAVCLLVTNLCIRISWSENVRR